MGWYEGNELQTDGVGHRGQETNLSGAHLQCTVRIGGPWCLEFGRGGDRMGVLGTTPPALIATNV